MSNSFYPSIDDALEGVENAADAKANLTAWEPSWIDSFAWRAEASSQKAQVAAQNTKDGMARAGEQISQKAHDIKEGAKDKWSATKEYVGEKVDNALEGVENAAHRARQ